MIPLLLALLLLCSCGVKAPPIPRDMLVPDAPKGTTLKVREGKLYLEWRPPEENVDGSRPVELIGFQVLRRRGCPTCPGEFEVVGEVPFSPQRGQYLWLEENPLQDGETYIYRVRGLNKWGFAGPPSEDLAILWIPPAPPPEGLRGEGGDRMTKLHWDGAPRAEAYHVYRRPASDPYPLDPIATVRTTAFTDRGVENGKTFCYQVRSVVFAAEVPIEGGGSEEVCITPEDLTPPPPPEGLVAFRRGREVELDWFPVEAEAVRGYHVWRGRCGEGMSRITKSPVQETLYTDVLPGRGCWRYAVSAVDASPKGNESPPSEAVEVRY